MPSPVKVHFESGPSPRIAFVGEAPSYEELANGRPLVGPSGRVHDAILRASGIDRSACWTGNVFEEQAPNNDTSGWLRNKAIYEPALKRLAKEMSDVRPNIIVPLGGTALWAFNGQTNISAYRGNVLLADRTSPGTKLLPTWHPAYVIRQWKLYTVVIHDYIRALSESASRTIKYPRRKFIIAPTLAEIKQFAKRCLATKLPVGVDIETTNIGQITSIGFSLGDEEAINIPFWDNRKPNRCYWGSADFELQAWLEVKKICESECEKWGQNFAGYDWIWLLEQRGIRVRNFRHDTRLMHHARFPELPKSLEFMAGSYSRQGPWKTLGWRGTEKRDD